MTRTRLSASLAGALVLAACNMDRPVSPAAAPQDAARSVSTSASQRYLVVASPSGFASDFAAKVAALGGSVSHMHAGAGIAVVSGISDASVGALGALKNVSEVQPDAVITLDTPVASVTADATSLGDVGVTSVSNPAAAPRYSWQWNMRDIHAQDAWAAGKLGSASVTVAILDTGIDYDNPDLNGLVDLSRSVSLVASDNALTAQYFPSRNPISDYHGHGTNVAAQVSSKAAVHAGVTSKTTLIGVKVLAANGSGSLGDVLDGVLWAADHGADVANMSLGGGFTKAGNGQYVSLINRVFNYANKAGMLVVVAAGNDNLDMDHDGNFLPTYCAQQHVVCVSAVGPATVTSNPDTPSYYTNIGRSSITVAGPGGNADAANGFTASAWPWGLDIASWVWSYCSKTRLAGLTATGAPVLTACSLGNRVTGYIGTSQATPHVAGLAALLVAEKGKGHPTQIKNAIQNSADDLGQSGTDPFFGKGRINVAKALGL